MTKDEMQANIALQEEPSNKGIKKLKIQREVLLRGLSIVSKAVGNKGTIPILGNILLESDGEKLKLGATDLEIAKTCLVEISEGEEFSTTVPAKIFLELISAIQSEELDFEYNPEKLSLKIKSERSNNNVRCLSADDFPEMPIFPEESTLSMPSETFRLLVQRTMFSAAGPDAGQPLYRGILMEAKDGELAVVSTDGFRFSVEKLPVKCADFSMVIPAVHLNEVARTSESEVEMAVLKNSMMFKSGDVVSGILTLDGKFPKLRDFQPSEENAVEVKAKTSDLYKAVKHASLFCEEAKRTLNLDFKLVSEIFAQADQVGDSVVSLALEVNGEAKVNLNADFLMGILGVAGERTKIFVSGKDKPVLFKLEGIDDYIHVMMPIKA